MMLATSEALPPVEWGLKGERRTRSPAGTLTDSQTDMCGRATISHRKSSLRLKSNR